MKKLFTLILSFLSFSVIASSDPKVAYEMYQQGQAIIIDVRESDELGPGMVDGAEWFPMSKVLSDKNWKEEFLKQTKDKAIFLYCRTGNRSGKVQKILEDNGINSENIGGYESLKNILPVKKPAKK